MQKAYKNTKKTRGVHEMNNARTCPIRRSKPVGPLTVCKDMDCFKSCVEITIQEKERGRMDYRYEKRNGG